MSENLLKAVESLGLVIGHHEGRAAALTEKLEAATPHLEELSRLKAEVEELRKLRPLELEVARLKKRALDAEGAATQARMDARVAVDGRKQEGAKLAGQLRVLQAEKNDVEAERDRHLNETRKLSVALAAEKQLAEDRKDTIDELAAELGLRNSLLQDAQQEIAELRSRKRGGLRRKKKDAT